jgi:hypothetical protein
MQNLLGLVAAAVVFTSPGPQDAAPAKKWTQAELEKVSEEIRGDIEQQRGAKFSRPVKVQVTDAKGFLEYAKKRQEKTETPERRVRDETIAKMLGLIDPDLDLQAALEKLLEGQVGGFYEPGADTFYLMESFGGDIARIILAHELTHALDDQLYDLDGTLKKLGQRTDAEFAYSAVVEGSGTSAMNKWMFAHLQNLDKKALMESGDITTRGLEDAPQFLWKPLIAVYLRGEGFLVRTEGMNIAMKAAAADDLKQAFQHPPRSSEQILHPQKYWDPKEADEPRDVEIDASKLPAGWKSMGDDTLGEIYLAMATTPADARTPFDPKNPLAILGLDYTNEAAKGWGGDRAVLLQKGDARVLWLVTAWDRPEDAEEFRAAAEKVLASAPGAKEFRRKVEREGDGDVVVVEVAKGVEEKDVPKPAFKVAPAKR